MLVQSSLGALAGLGSGKPITAFLGTLGWVAVLWFIRLLFTGRLITGREADERDKRYGEKVEECRELRSTLAGMTDAMETCNAMIAAVMAEAEQEEQQAPPRRPTGVPPRGWRG